MKSKRPTLDVTHPDLALQWHPTKNEELSPSDVTPGSSKHVWWTCPVDGYEFSARVSHRASGSGCPVCGGTKIAAGINDVLTAHPHLIKQVDASRNSLETVSQLGSNSATPVYWKLVPCGHTWAQPPRARVKAQPTHCPVCTGDVLVSGVNDLQTRFPEIAAEWHPTKNGSSLAHQVTSGSGRIAWWYRLECEHEWPAKVQARTGKDKAGCLVCSNRLIVPGINDVATTHPHLMLEWHPTKNEDVDASTLSSGNKQRIWWKCVKNHVWDTHLYNRTGPGKRGCPTCAKRHSKGERELADFVESLVPIVRSSRMVLPSRNELDIYVPSLALAIEFNGVYWHSEQRGKGQWYHHKKWSDCKRQGITLIQIWEDDWRRNPAAVKSVIRNRLTQPAKKTDAVRLQRCTSTEAQQFLRNHDPREVKAGDLNYAALSSSGQIVAVLSATSEAPAGSMTLNAYAEKNSTHDMFARLLAHLVDENRPSVVQASSDNCMDVGSMYQQAGFNIAGEKEPSWTYIHQNKRVPSQHPGVSAQALRVWDAGYTVWEKNY